jgi:AraC-like DNA-binding protein
MLTDEVSMNHIALNRLTPDYLQLFSQQIHKMRDEHRLDAMNDFLQRINLSLSEDRDTTKLSHVSETILVEVKRFIIENLHRVELSPEYLAKHFNFSLRYLYNLFENEALSVAGYIKEARLTRAKNKILATMGTHKTISEIAYSVGFNNMSHFCKVFKSRFNQTPMEMKNHQACVASEIF